MRVALKTAILQRGWSQRQVSKLADIPENRLSSIINGWTNPTPYERGRLSTLLQLPADVLFDPGASVEIRSAR